MPEYDDTLHARFAAAIAKAKAESEQTGYAKGFTEGVRSATGTVDVVVKALTPVFHKAHELEGDPTPHAALYESLLRAIADTEPGSDERHAILDRFEELHGDPEALAGVLADVSGDEVTKAIGGLFRKAWDKEKHPRSDDGRFVSKDAIQDAASDPAKAAELRKRVTDPEQRKKLDAAIADQDSTVGRTKRGQSRHESRQRRAKVHADRSRAKELAGKVASGEASPEDVEELTGHLAGLRGDDLRYLLSQIPTTGGGRTKAGMVAALTRALTEPKESEGPEAGPANAGAEPPPHQLSKKDFVSSFDPSKHRGEVVTILGVKVKLGRAKKGDRYMDGVVVDKGKTTAAGYEPGSTVRLSVEQAAEDIHRSKVQGAVEAGELPPDDVLADYTFAAQKVAERTPGDHLDRSKLPAGVVVDSSARPDGNVEYAVTLPPGHHPQAERHLRARGYVHEWKGERWLRTGPPPLPAASPTPPLTDSQRGDPSAPGGAEGGGKSKSGSRPKKYSRVKTIPLSAITFPGGLSKEVSPLDDNKDEPIIVEEKGDKYRLIDGFGRASGLANAGNSSVHAIVVTPEDIAENKSGQGDDPQWVADMHHRYAPSSRMAMSREDWDEREATRSSEAETRRRQDLRDQEKERESRAKAEAERQAISPHKRERDDLVKTLREFGLSGLPMGVGGKITPNEEFDIFDRGDPAATAKAQRAVAEHLAETAAGVGKPVHPDVLADYPDLAAKYAPKVEAKPKDAAPPLADSQRGTPNTPSDTANRPAGGDLGGDGREDAVGSDAGKGPEVPAPGSASQAEWDMIPPPAPDRFPNQAARKQLTKQVWRATLEVASRLRDSLGENWEQQLSPEDYRLFSRIYRFRETLSSGQVRDGLRNAAPLDAESYAGFYNGAVETLEQFRRAAVERYGASPTAPAQQPPAVTSEAKPQEAGQAAPSAPDPLAPHIDRLAPLVEMGQHRVVTVELVNKVMSDVEKLPQSQIVELANRLLPGGFAGKRRADASYAIRKRMLTANPWFAGADDWDNWSKDQVTEEPTVSDADRERYRQQHAPKVPPSVEVTKPTLSPRPTEPKTAKPKASANEAVVNEHAARFAPLVERAKGERFPQEFIDEAVKSVEHLPEAEVRAIASKVTGIGLQFIKTKRQALGEIRGKLMPLQRYDDSQLA